MEHESSFEFNKPQSSVEGKKVATEDLQIEDMRMSRRDFLKFVVAGAASLLVNPDEAFGKQEKKTKMPEVPVEKIIFGKERGMIGRSSNLEALHRSVSNGFEDMIEEEIKNPSKKLSISNFKGHIGRERGGYVLSYSVDLTPVEKEEKAHRVFSIRGRVCGESDAMDKVHNLYTKTIPQWQERMKKEYPGVNFTTEVDEDGGDRVYHKTCIMKGVSKKR